MSATVSNAKPLISVLMGVYNSEMYLKSAIRSILAQTYTNFELLIIDDGSKDGSAAILDEFAKSDPRVRVLHQPNQGLTASLNQLVGIAQGELFARIDADDISYPERFAQQVEYLQKHPDVGVVCTWAQFISGKSITSQCICYPDNHDLIVKLLNADTNPIIHSSVMYRREILSQIGEPPYRFRIAQDFDMWLRLSTRTRFGVVESLLVAHRQHVDRITNKYTSVRYSLREQIKELHRRRLAGQDEGDWQAQQQAILTNMTQKELEPVYDTKLYEAFIEAVFLQESGASSSEVRGLLRKSWALPQVRTKVLIRGLLSYVPRGLRLRLIDSKNRRHDPYLRRIYEILTPAQERKLEAAMGLFYAEEDLTLAVDETRTNAAPTHAHLAVFLTPGISLQDWERNGVLKREIQPYLFHIKRGGRVTFAQTHMAPPPSLPDGVSVVRIPHVWLIPLLRFLPLAWLKSVDVFKTNQTGGADTFVRLARALKKPIVLRCGNIAGERQEVIHGLTPDVIAFQRKEGWAFRNATLIEVPTEELADWAVEHYQVAREKLRVIPNFVDTAHFQPKPSPQNTQPTIVSVGRLVPQKRFEWLVEACNLVENVCLMIAGDGPERASLTALADTLGVSLELPGIIANEQLPDFLSRGQIFVLASVWEGHPKALIEAMACGMACVCVDAVGIRNQIAHEHNGLLVAPNPQAIADGITRLLRDPILRERLGSQARQSIIEKYDIMSVLAADAKVIDEALPPNNQTRNEQK